ncbi:hypothetical protein BH11PSE3_BH11PSE3_32530 [soil metagenome]
MLGLAFLLVTCLVCGPELAFAEDAERWNAPFGGAFNATFTVTSDYSVGGISQTKLGPAAQVSLDYRTREVSAELPVWFYMSAWGSNYDFPTTGPGIEVDLAAGFKTKILNRKLSIDVGYIRYLYLGSPADLNYDYGDFSLNVGYDFGFATLAGRLRVSPNSFGASGISANKRGLLSVPLPFLQFNENIAFKAYGSVGNISVEQFPLYGLPSADYWYWQFGLVTSAYGLDFSAAYTDTSIERSGCGNTSYCSGRVFFSVSKAF